MGSPGRTASMRPRGKTENALLVAMKERQERGRQPNEKLTLGEVAGRWLASIEASYPAPVTRSANKFPQRRDTKARRGTPYLPGRSIGNHER